MQLYADYIDSFVGAPQKRHNPGHSARRLGVRFFFVPFKPNQSNVADSRLQLKGHYLPPALKKYPPAVAIM